MAQRVPARLSPAAGRKFGLTLGIAFAVLGGIATWRGHPTTATVLGTTAGVLLLSALVVPTWLGPVERAWMGMAHAISWVTTPIFMGIVYFLVVTPVGLLVRAVKGNPLVRANSDQTCWVPRDVRVPDRSTMQRQF